MTTHTVDPFSAWETAGFGERALEYHRFAVPFTSRAVEPLLDAAAIGPRARVLDVATGPGYLAAACVARGATAVGVDLAGGMVSLARRLHPGIEFLEADAQRLPFPAGSFDAVVGNFAILHLPRPEQAVREFARVLVPGGWVALSTWDLPERARHVGVFLDAATEAGATFPADLPEPPPFFRFSDEAEFTRLLEGAGLRDVAVCTIAFTHRLSSADEYWDGMVQATVRTGALVYGQPDEVQARIRSAFDRLVRGYEVNGGLEVPISVKVASGRLTAASTQRRGTG